MLLVGCWLRWPGDCKWSRLTVLLLERLLGALALHWGSLEALGLPLRFSGSSFSAVRPSLNLYHTDTSFRLRTILQWTLANLRWILLWLIPSVCKNLITVLTSRPVILFACKAWTCGWRTATLTRLLLYRTYQCRQMTPRYRAQAIYNNQTKKKTPRPESASELYRSSNSRLSTKLVPIFGDRWLSGSQSGGFSTEVISIFRPFLSSSFSIVLTTLSGPRSRSTTSEEIW
jgi:hypothetical protein